jgi:DNA repair protein MmcB-like
MGTFNGKDGLDIRSFPNGNIVAKGEAVGTKCARSGTRSSIPESVPIEIMPEDPGPILAVREAVERRMASATRRSMLVRFAHAAVACTSKRRRRCGARRLMYFM